MKKLGFVSAVLLTIAIGAAVFGRGWYTKLNDSSPANLIQTTDHSFDGEVLIVGAGAAGLAAAMALKRHGVPYTILEATDRYGGRVKKNDSFADFPIDLGAEWIHFDASILNRLIGVKSEESPAELIQYTPREIYSWDGESYTQSSHTINSLMYWSFPEYKFKNTTWFDFIDQHFARRVKDRIVFNSALTHIDYGGDKIVALTQDGRRFETDKLILTVSTGVLQKGSITFNPDLSPERMAAINAIDFLPGFKLFLKFHRKFYADVIEHYTADGSAYFFDAAFGKDTKDHVLALLVTGSEAHRYYNLGGEDTIVAEVLKELDTIYSGQATSLYTGDHLLINWGQNPFTLGTWTNEVGSAEQMELLGLPIQNKVYFSGAALERHGQYATVHGAIMAGYGVVSDVLSPYSD
ncbi:MAG: NAD(P)/FAD-dependent oxidoreductase [Pseudomonadota bacterium]